MRLPRRRDWSRSHVLAAVVLALVLVAAVLTVRLLHHRDRLQEALASVPAGTERVSFTDWAAVRQRVAGSDAPLRAARVQALTDRAYELDLSTASSISESGSALDSKLGFGPGNAAWEAFAQSPRGAAMVLKTSDDVDLDDVASRLRSAGYDAPGDDDGVWRGGADLVSTLDPTITPELGYVALDRGRHLVVSSDSPSYAETALRAATGDADTLAGSDAGGRAEQLAGRVEGLASAVVWPGDFACEDLSMSQAAAEDREAADARVSDLGGVSPLTGLVVGERPDGGVRVAMGFESDDQAEENLRPRAELVVGADPSRPQTVGQTYRLTRTRTQGDDVLLDLRPRPDVGASLTTLTAGPVLFATC